MENEGTAKACEGLHASALPPTPAALAFLPPTLAALASLPPTPAALASSQHRIVGSSGKSRSVRWGCSRVLTVTAEGFQKRHVGQRLSDLILGSGVGRREHGNFQWTRAFLVCMELLSLVNAVYVGGVRDPVTNCGSSKVYFIFALSV